MKRELAIEFSRVTEAAALAGYKWLGRGDKNTADGAAVNAMRIMLNLVNIDGTIVIGEGEIDEAPMLYIGEKAIEHFAQSRQLPVVHNVCPADKHTKRQEVKELIAQLQTQYPDLKSKIFGAMQRLPLPQWGPDAPEASKHG